MVLEARGRQDLVLELTRNTTWCSRLKNFCDGCGTPLLVVCGACDNPEHADNLFCTSCGPDLSVEAEPFRVDRPGDPDREASAE